MIRFAIGLLVVLTATIQQPESRIGNLLSFDGQTDVFYDDSLVRFEDRDNSQDVSTGDTFFWICHIDNMGISGNQHWNHDTDRFHIVFVISWIVVEDDQLAPHPDGLLVLDSEIIAAANLGPETAGIVLARKIVQPSNISLRPLGASYHEIGSFFTGRNNYQWEMTLAGYFGETETDLSDPSGLVQLGSFTVSSALFEVDEWKLIEALNFDGEIVLGELPYVGVIYSPAAQWDQKEGWTHNAFLDLQINGCNK